MMTSFVMKMETATSKYVIEDALKIGFYFGLGLTGELRN